MASASGGGCPAVRFHVGLIVSDKHRDLENLVIIQKKLKQKLCDLQCFLGETSGFTFLHIEDILLEEETSSIYFVCTVNSYEELKEFYNASKDTKVTSAIAKYVSQIELYKEVKPPTGLKLFLPLPGATFYTVGSLFEAKDGTDVASFVEGKPEKMADEVKAKGDGNTPDKSVHERKEAGQSTLEDESPINATSAASQASQDTSDMKHHSQSTTDQTEESRWSKQMQSVSEKRVVEKKFKVFIPEKWYSFCIVRIVSDKCKEINGRNLNYNKTTGIWECIVQMPFEKLHENSTYQYEENVLYTTYTHASIGFQYLSDTFLSQVQELKSSLEQRDIFNKNVEVESVTVHLKDIIHQSSRSENLKECIMQIEDLLKSTNFLLEVRQRVIQSICRDLKDQDKVKSVLYAIVIGNFLDNPAMLRMKYLEKSKATQILAKLRAYKLEDFPSSCVKYISVTCQSLSVLCTSRDTGLVQFMAQCYPLLSEGHLNLWFDNPETDNLVSTSECDVSAVIYLTKQAIDKLTEGATEATIKGVKTFMHNLIRLSPLKVTQQILERMRQIGSSHACSLFYEFIETCYERTRLHTRKSKDILQLLQLWDFIAKEKDLVEFYHTKFEEFILEYLASGEDGVEHNLMQLVLTSGLFETINFQTELVRILGTSKSLKLYLNFRDVMKESKFSMCLHDLEARIFQNWFETLTSTHLTALKESKVKALYLHVFKVLEIIPSTRKEKIQKLFDAMMVSYMQKIDIKEFLSSLRDADSACPKHYKDMCANHVSAVLGFKGRRITSQDIFNALTNARGKRLLDTRLVAAAACFGVENCHPLPESLSEIDCLKAITKHREMWVTVLACDGEYKYLLEDCLSYRKATSCILSVLGLLTDNNIPYQFYIETNLQDHNIKEILYTTTVSRSEIDKSIDENYKRCINEKNRIMVVQSVVNILKDNVTNGLPDTFDLYIKEIDEFVHEFDKMKASEYLVKFKALFQNQDVFRLCELSSKVVKSKVYWNTFREKSIELKFESPEEEPVLEDVCTSFGDMNIESHPDFTSISCQPNYIQCAGFVCKVLEMANRIYTDKWKMIQDNPEIDMKQVFSMFVNSFKDMREEIYFAEVHLQHQVSEECKTCLARLGKLETAKRIVSATVPAACAFGLKLGDDEDFKRAVTSFRALLSDESTRLAFREVGNQLKIIFGIAENLDEQTTDILQSIGVASPLVDFLRRIINEDIRNLIDAVEDISEQHVSESTVSALIDVKRFFKPLLEMPKQTCIDLFYAIQGQAQNLGKLAQSLPSKIHDCMSNLHKLMSLYNNVANRGEQTKEIIKNIMKQGEFHFYLAPDQKVCDLTASYTQAKSKPKIHSKIALCDFRSRALLLMNSERHANERSMTELDKFVNAINMCLDIADCTYELHSSGHLKYQDFKRTVPFDHLEELQKCLLEDLHHWNANLTNIRETFYLMNFIQGKHIHVLDRFLEKGIEHKMVDIILKFLHPNLNAEILQQEFTRFKLEMESMGTFDVLTALGMALTSSFKKLDPLQRTVQATDDKGKRMTDIVKSGRILIVRIDEGNVLVIKTLLALYLRTSNRIPEPSEVLLCTRETTWSEVQLLLGRCFNAYSFFGTEALYCMANVEILPNEIHFRLIDELKNLTKRHHFKLVIICQGSTNHPFLDEFYENVTTVRPLSDETVRKIFLEVCPYVFTYTSESAGLGKTCAIISKAKKNRKVVKTLHISGSVKKRKLIEILKTLNLHKEVLLHIDIGFVNNPLELDLFLFELIILKFSVADGMAIDLSSSYVCIEIANTINNTLRNSLQTAVSFQRNHMEWSNFRDFVVSTEINSPVQIVCHYLYSLEKGTVDKTDLTFSGDASAKPLPTGVCRYILQKYFSLSDTYIVTNTCIGVLADQLKKMSNSAFFKTSRVRDMTNQTSGLKIKSTMVNALVEVSKELASRSVDAYRSTQRQTLDYKFSKSTEGARMDLAASATKHVEHMIRWEDSNHLIYVFHNQNIQTISPMYRDLTLVPKHIKDLFESQMKRPLCEFKSLKQVELQDVLQKVARTNPIPLPPDKLVNLAKDYALTPDNLLKMVLIILRIKSRVPVLVMGETGCGKTSLIRYLAAICEVDLEVLSIHAGVEDSTIMNKVLDYNDRAAKQLEEEKWLFLDEINTSEYIGIISDMICHHLCLGKMLSPNLVILSACNPYKLRSSRSILTSGLKGKGNIDELSRLVYRVLPLPEMLVDYVWDFGSLTEKDEKMYIDRMVEGLFEHSPNSHKVFVDLLSMSQKFARSVDETTSSVSLRDIQRCKILTEWFYQVLLKKTPKFKIVYRWTQIEKERAAIILSLAHCYLSRFSDKDIRKRYLEKMESEFRYCGLPTYSAEHIQKVIKQEQNDILLRMELPPGTAQNPALRENVFIVLVCILNRIPIFVVGKPGCSKSLSLQVIKSNLRGKDSRNEFFKTLPQLYCVSFQGSESSTSDGILKVFEKAEKYQKANNTDDVLSVVILDEIGLAEISRFNPLKVLHNLLEPDGKIRPNVAVVGVSNWSLDASKMNRAIHLSRSEMDEEELYETAMFICDSFQKEEKKDFLKHMEADSYTFKTQDIAEHLKDLAKSYTDYMRALRFENFHGLRDYYSLIKYIAREISCSKQRPSEEKVVKVISCGIERNFGGLPAERETLFSKFHIAPTKITPVLELVTENVADPLARHLMIITTGQSVLGIIERSLKLAKRDKREILFGSKFEEDLTDDYNYRMLSRIILCMEQGIVLILKDLESIYGSLYDMLNKNYTEIGKKKHCRVALGAYTNPICHVHEHFRCIVLVDETQVDYTDPPFLNRFEKQNVNFADIIEESQKDVIVKIEKWIEEFSTVEGRNFTKEDCLPIYSTDMTASYVILKEERGKTTSQENIQCDFIWLMKPDAVIRSHRAPAEEVRIEADIYQKHFFDLPLHTGLQGLLKFHRKESYGKENLMTIVFTNSSIHSRSLHSISDVSKQIEKLGAFKSEKQLSTKLQLFWMESDTEVLFVQCSAIDDEKHIMLAKSVIERNRSEFISSNPAMFKDVYMIIHLDKSKGRSAVVPQLNFLCGWQLVTLDSIECPSTPLPSLCRLSLSKAVEAKRPLNVYVADQFFWSFTRIKYNKNGRGINSINTALNKMRQCESFIEVVEEQVCSWIVNNHPGVHSTEWQETVACDPHALDTSLTLVDALEKRILQTINAPLCKYIYQMECLGIIDSYFVEDEVSEGRRLVWTKLLSNASLFSIMNIHDELGPETLYCDIEDLSLKMPFCLHIWKCVETTREEFLISVTLLQGLSKFDQDEDLPAEVIDKLLKKQEMVILDKLPGLETFLYESCMNDYIEDFCNIVTFDKCHGLKKNKKISIMKWILEQQVDLRQAEFSVLLTNLHTTFWSNSELFYAQLQLFELCQSKDMSEEGTSYEWSGSSSVTSNDDVQYFNTESKIVDILCKKMIPTEEVVAHHSGLAAWRWKVNYMLRFAANVSVEPSSLHALRLCNDIATELFQTTMHSSSFVTIAEHLKSGKALDTKAVFSTLIKLLNERRNDMSKACQRIFSDYLLRCLGLSSKTKAMELFLHAVNKGMVPDRQLSYLKLPVSTKLKNESWKFQMNILRKPDTWVDETTSTFIVLLDECLKATFKGKNALSSLVIDILLEIYMDAFSKEDKKEAIFKDLFLDGHRCLKCGFGLSVLAGVAYCKAYIVCFLLKDGVLSEECLQEVLPVFRSTSEDDTSHSLLMYFMKMLGMKSPMAKFWIYCKSQKDKLPFVDKLRCLLEDGSDISLCAEMCPLRVHAPMTTEHVVHLIKTTDKVAISNEWEKIFTDSKNNDQCIISILGAAMSHFYLPRIYSEIDDTKVMQATELLSISEKSSLTRSRNLLKCLLGKQDFEVPDFMIHRGSSSTDFYISSVLISLYILLHAEQECSNSDQMSVLTSCLLKPTIVKNIYLPGVPDSNVSPTDPFIGQLHVSSGTLYSTCSCGIRLCSTQASILCVNCSSANKGVEEFPALDIEDHPSKPGFVPSNSETTVRKLSPIIFNILSLLTKGCLLGSVALGHANTNDIEYIGVPEDALQVLWNDLESHWKSLLVIMNMEEYHLSFLFQALFVKIRKFICEEKTQLTTMTERCDWEESFTLHVKDMLAEKFSSVNEIFDDHRCNGAQGLFEMESCLRELGGEGKHSTEHQQPPMMDLFRLHGQPSMKNFISEFHNVRQQFPFLQLVLQSYKELSMPKHVMPIVQWHLIVTSTISNTMKKHECMSMTVTKFIELTDNEDARKTRRNCFEALQKAWDDLKGHLKDTDVLADCPDRFEEDTKLSKCLILDENYALYNVLCFLVQIHNGFLDKSLAVALGCNSVKFLCRKPDVAMIHCVNLSKVTAKQLVDFSAQWQEFLTNDSQSDLAYGSGRHIVYDFFSIEKGLAVHLLNGKAYINVKDNWPRIIFTDELYRNFSSLIKELRECIKQTHIPKQTVQSIYAKYKKNPKKVTELLTHLGIIMALLKKTKEEPEMALVDYVENWKIIMTRSLPEDLLPSPSSCIKLGHVVALHEILEELSATSIVNALEENYRQRMDTDMESHFCKLVQNQLKVSEVILGTMKRFVYRCLSIRDADPTREMAEYLADESFWPVDVCTDKRIHVGDEVFHVGDLIPEGLMVRHVYSTVTFLEEEIEKNRSTDPNRYKMEASISVIDASKSQARRKEHKINKKIQDLRNF